MDEKPLATQHELWCRGVIWHDDSGGQYFCLTCRSDWRNAYGAS